MKYEEKRLSLQRHLSKIESLQTHLKERDQENERNDEKKEQACGYAD